MARTWLSGFELQDATATVEWNISTNSPAIDTTIKRSGAASLKTSPTGGTSLISHVIDAAGNTNAHYARFYLYIDTAPGAIVQIFQFRAVSGTVAASIRLNANRTLELWGGSNNGTQQGSDSSALSLATWYRIEISLADTSANQTAAVEAKIDGTAFASGTAAVTGASSEVDDFRLGTITGTQSPVLYFDDVAINDNTGSAQTGYPGAGQLVLLTPSSAGDNDPSAGTWDSIDEIPPSDADYIELDLPGTIGDFNLNTAASVGIGSSDTVTLVAVGARVRGEDSSSSCSYHARIKSASGGTVQDGTVVTLSSATFQTHDDTTAARQYKLIAYVDPTTGVAWTPTGTNSIDNMQIGANPDDAVPDIWISSLWAYVEVVSLSGGGGGGGTDTVLTGLIGGQGYIPTYL